jgi:hypothetical protein
MIESLTTLLFWQLLGEAFPGVFALLAALGR